MVPGMNHYGLLEHPTFLESMCCGSGGENALCWPDIPAHGVSPLYARCCFPLLPPRLERPPEWAVTEHQRLHMGERIARSVRGAVSFRRLCSTSI